MLLRSRLKGSCTALVALTLALVVAPGRGQQNAAPFVDLPDSPQIFDSSARGPSGVRSLVRSSASCR